MGIRAIKDRPTLLIKRKQSQNTQMT